MARSQRTEVFRRPPAVVVLATCILLLVPGGEAAAAGAGPPGAVAGVGRPAPSPVQRWGSAGEESRVVGGPGNRSATVSLRQRYPLRKAVSVPQPPANAAHVVASPRTNRIAGFNPRTSVELPRARTAATTRRYANADGTQTTTFSVPVNPGAADATMVVHGSSSRAGGAELLVGNVGGAAAASYLKFGGPVDRLRYHTIHGVQLSIVEYDAPSCSPRPVTVHAVTQGWSPGSGYAYPGPAVGGALAARSFAYGHIAPGQTRSACPTNRALFDLGRGGRDLVQSWVNGGPNNGLSLRASATDPLGWKRFTGAGTANPPTLFVTHSPYNADYAIPNPVPNPPVLQNQAGVVKVTVVNRSAEAWDPSAYYLAYRAYDAGTHRLVTQRRSASLPRTVARGQRVTVDARIESLPPGKYFLDFTMVRTGGVVFTDQQVPPARIVLVVIDIPPVLQELYPPNGYHTPTLTPQLWARAVDIDAPPASTLRFGFEVCELTDAGARIGCFASGDTTRQAWPVPAGKLFWSKDYQWRASVKDGSNTVTSEWVNLVTAVPQPEVTGRVAGAPYGSQDRDFDPQVGNFTTAAVDASVLTAGPSLTLTRTYNSLDPRRDLSFGAGWVTQLDMRVTPDDDGSGNVVATYQDGQQVRYGRNPDGGYAAPPGRAATLIASGTSYTLDDRSGRSYRFGASGRLVSISDAALRSVNLSYDAAGKLAKAYAAVGGQTGTTGRSLRFTWTGNHITAVTDDTGNAWTYAYTGDLLTRVCAPNGDCTEYAYAPGSHYRTAVLDSGPESYWRLGEAEGAGAGSEVAVNLGKDSGTYRAVTLAEPGIPGAVPSGATAGRFNGSKSMVELSKGTLKRSRDAAIELWFKLAPTDGGGPLAGYQDAKLDSASGTGVPLLYVGSDGKLYGQFATGTVQPLDSGGIKVNDGDWHHAVLSAAGSTQTLWLDGQAVDTMTATLEHSTLTFNQIGAAYASSPTSWPAWGSTARRFFSGTVDEVAIYHHPLGKAAVTAHRDHGRAAADQLTTVKLPSGRIAAEVAYDVGLDRVKEYTDADGGTWKLGKPAVYGGDSDLRRSVQVLDPANRSYLYEYDAIAGRLLRTGTPLGIGTREEDMTGYANPSPTPTSSPTETCTRPDPNDPPFCVILPGDPGGPPFVVQPLDGLAIRTFGYDDRGYQNLVVNENGDSVELTYDDRGNVTAVKTCRTTNQCFTERHTYPPPSSNPLDPRNDLPTEYRDGRSTGSTDNTYLTRYTYTARGDLLTQTNPDGGTIRHGYTTGAEQAVGGGTVPPGLLTTTTDPRGAVTKYTYRTNGDLAEVAEPSGLVTRFAYDTLGRLVSETEVSDSFPAGVTATYAYDRLSRPVSTMEPTTTDAVTGVRHQRVSQRTYDADGNVTSIRVKDALSGDEIRVTSYEYDASGRMSRETDAEGNVTSYEYDRFGNRVGAVDARGTDLRYAYTARNQLAEVRLRSWDGDPPGAPPLGEYLVVASYAYDHGGRLARQTDAMGRRTEYTYFHDDLLATAKLNGFVLESNTYDGAGNVVRQVSGNGAQLVEYAYTKTGQVASFTVDPGGLNRRTAYGYDLTGNMISVTQSGNASGVPWAMPATGPTVPYQYDLAGNLTREAVGSTVTTHRYDQRGLRTTTTEPRGNVEGADPAAYTTTYRYDELGRQTTVASPSVTAEADGTGPQTVQPAVTAGYNAFGEVVHRRDERGAVWRSAYDGLGRLVTASAPTYTPPGPSTVSTPTVQLRYDPVGNLAETVDPRGNAIRYTYDRLNRLTSRDQPAASNDDRAVWAYTYTRTGQVLSVTDPTGARTEYTYDDHDRRVTSTQIERRPTAGNFTTRYRYDDAGNLVSVTSPSRAESAMEYDKTGALVRSVDPHGVAEQYGYDLAGRQVRHSDGIGRTRRVDYDDLGRVIRESDHASPAGAPLRTTAYGYDVAGNRTSVTDATGRTATYAYDALSRLVRQVEPVSAAKSITTTFGYDAAGNRTRYTDGRGNATNYTYNVLGLPESVIAPSTVAHPERADRTWTASYDAAGLPVKLVAPGGVVRQRTFDAAGRLTAETGTGAEAGTTERRLGYDAAGRTTSVSAPGGTNTYAYSDRGALLSANGPSGASSFEYDGDGNVIARTGRAGTAGYTYDRGRIATETDGVTGLTQRLRYNAAGEVSAVDYGSGRVRSYGYDEFGRVVSDSMRNGAGSTVAAVGYEFDAEDRLTAKTTTGIARAGRNTYTYDFAGRLTSWTASGTVTAYEWDDSGNRIRNGGKTASYDARNRLLADSDHSYAYTGRGTMKSSTSAGQIRQYAFDAFDRLVSGEGQAYTYDGLDRVAARNGASFAYDGFSAEPAFDGAQSYARGAAGDLLAVSEGEQERIVLPDGHEDVVAGFAPGNTTLSSVEESRAYSPFGEVVAEDAVLDVNAGFQGDYTDPATGHVHMGARWYDPATGVFDSSDSLGYASGPSILANLYAYGAGDPLTNVDPDGHKPCKGNSRKRLAKQQQCPKYDKKKDAEKAKRERAKRLAEQRRERQEREERVRRQRINERLREQAERRAEEALGGGSSGGGTGSAAGRAAGQAARDVTREARNAARSAAQRIPVPIPPAATRPTYSGRSTPPVSSSPHVPARSVDVVRDVVRDVTTAVNAIYQEAVDHAGPVIRDVSTASRAAAAVSAGPAASGPDIMGYHGGNGDYRNNDHLNRDGRDDDDLAVEVVSGAGLAADVAGEGLQNCSTTACRRIANAVRVAGAGADVVGVVLECSRRRGARCIQAGVVLLAKVFVPGAGPVITAIQVLQVTGLGDHYIDLVNDVLGEQSPQNHGTVLQTDPEVIEEYGRPVYETGSSNPTMSESGLPVGRGQVAPPAGCPLRNPRGVEPEPGC